MSTSYQPTITSQLPSGISYTTGAYFNHTSFHHTYLAPFAPDCESYGW